MRIQTRSLPADVGPVVAQASVMSPERTDVVSPELVLVDPALALRARERLGEPGDSFRQARGHSTPISWEPRYSADGRIPPLGVGTDQAVRRLAEEALAASLAEPASFRSRSRTRVAVVLLGLSSAIAAVALVVDAVLPLGGPPTALELSTSVPPPTIQPGDIAGETGPVPEKPTRASPPSGPPTDRTSPPKRGKVRTTPTRTVSAPRRFAWAPAANAVGYHVELFRGPSRVFAADTTRAQITIPARWRLDGRTYRLRPGEYRWYVWPVVAGRRGSQAIVRARLAVPAG